MDDCSVRSSDSGYHLKVPRDPSVQTSRVRLSGVEIKVKSYDTVTSAKMPQETSDEGTSARERGEDSLLQGGERVSKGIQRSDRDE